MTARKRAGARGPREAPGRPRDPAAPRLLVAVLALSFALRAAASLLPIPRVWGLDALRVWPLAEAVIVLLLGAIGFAPAVARGMERVMDALGAFGGRAGLAVDAAVAVAAAALLYNLRDPMRWVGDLMTRVGQLLIDAPVSKVFPQAAPLDRWINILIPRALMSQGLDVTTALHLVGAVVGGVFTLVALSFLRATGASRAALVASATFLLGGGYMLHFSGYDKFGPLLVGLALAAAGAARLAREGRGATLLGAGLLVCLLSHRSGFALLPAGAWALFQGFRIAPDRRARIEAIAAVAVVVAAASVLLPRALHLLETIDRAQNLEGPVISGGTAVTRALAAAVIRTGDALNLLFLLAPLWPAGLAAAWLLWRAPAAANPKPAPQAAPGPGSPAREAPAVRAAARPPGAAAQAPTVATRGPTAARETEARFPLAPVALLAVLPALALLLVARGAQGVARDWDMHVGGALVIALASAGALVAAWRRLGSAGSLAPVVTTAVASALALWGTHVSAPIQMARIRHLLADRAAWTDGAWARAHDFLGVQALQQQRPEDAIRELEEAAAVAPNPRFFFQIGLAHRMVGRQEEARAAFEKAQTLDPRLADAWVGFALLAFDAGDWARAATCAESALAIAPHRKDAKEIRDKALALDPAERK